MEFGPDRLRQIVSHGFVRTGSASGRTNGGAESGKQVAPRMLVAALTGNYEAEIVSMQAIEKAIDRARVRRSVVFEDVFVSRGAQPCRQIFGVQRPWISRARQGAARTGKHQVVNLFRGQAQGKSI